MALDAYILLAHLQAGMAALRQAVELPRCFPLVRFSSEGDFELTFAVVEK